MPDGDVFARNAHRRWGRISRRVLGGGEVESAVEDAINVLTHCLKSMDPLLLGQLVHIVPSVQQLPRAERWAWIEAELGNLDSKVIPASWTR